MRLSLCFIPPFPYHLFLLEDVISLLELSHLLSPLEPRRPIERLRFLCTTILHDKPGFPNRLGHRCPCCNDMCTFPTRIGPLRTILNTFLLPLNRIGLWPTYCPTLRALLFLIFPLRLPNPLSLRDLLTLALTLRPPNLLSLCDLLTLPLTLRPPNLLTLRDLLTLALTLRPRNLLSLCDLLTLVVLRTANLLLVRDARSLLDHLVDRRILDLRYLFGSLCSLCALGGAC